MFNFFKKLKTPKIIERKKEKEKEKSFLERAIKKLREKRHNAFQSLSESKKSLFRKIKIYLFPSLSLALVFSPPSLELMRRVFVEQRIERALDVDDRKVIVEGESELEKTKGDRYIFYHISILKDYEKFKKLFSVDEVFRKNILKELHRDSQNEITEELVLEAYRFIQEKIEEHQKNIDDLKKKVLSKDFSDRLMREVEDEEQARKMIDMMVHNLENIRDKIYLSNFPYKIKDFTFAMFYGGLLSQYVKFPFSVDEYTQVHEFTHVLRYKTIPETTKWKLVSRINYEKLGKYTKEHLNKISHNGELFAVTPKEIRGLLKYYATPTEILARKSVFEHELEKKGIKKYGEPFTEEHYRKVIDLMKKGELNKNSIEFLHIYDKDALIEIMNTIAYEEHSLQEQDISHIQPEVS